MKRATRTYGIAAAALLAVLAAASLSVEIPHDLSTYARVMAAQEWVLTRSDNGMIVSVLRDNRSGAVRRYTATQIERGDALSLRIADIGEGQAVSIGDTVAWTTATDVEYAMAALQGELSVAEAALDAARSGEKPALIEEARRRLSYAAKAAEEQESLHARQRELHGKGMVSDEAFELSEDRLELLRISEDIAKAQLSAVSSGAKAEELLQRTREIAAIRGEIDAMRRRLALSSHVAPISGRLRVSRAADTLLVIEDTEERLLVIPVALEDAASVTVGAGVRFEAPELDVRGAGEIVGIGGEVQYHNGRPMMLMTARVTACSAAMPSGLLAACSVECAPLRLTAWLVRFFENILV